MSNMIKDNPDLTEQFADVFNDTFYLQTNSILGTLSKPITEEYDLILTNPPYVMNGSSNLKEEISKSEELKNYYAINAMGIEDDVETVDLEGYIGLINEVVNTLNEYNEPLRELGKKEQTVAEKEVLLSDEELFDLFIGPRKLKKDYVDSKGDIPVYSANVFEPFVYAEDSNIEDFHHNYVI